MKNKTLLQRFYAYFTYTFIAAFISFALPNIAFAEASFSKTFTPNAIGPGSVSTVTFTITNNDGFTLSGLAFNDVLPTVPGDVDIANPANASTSCLDGIVSAPAGGGSISLSGGKLGIGGSCTVTVDVTASTPGVHTNPAITLTYNELAGDPPSSSSADLTVTSTRPGFSKSFSPSSVALGAKSTLTFTIDNSLNASRVGNLDFTDNLPTGMLIADPANAVTDCISTSAPDTTLTATPGTSLITLDADGSTLFPGFEVLSIGASCTVTVDVVATGIGVLDNLSGELLADFVSVGSASASLDVTVTPLAIQKAFTNDPVPPGATVELKFMIDNFDRNFPATGVAFSDDLTTLAPPLAGLTFDSLLSNDCGGSVSGVGGTSIGLSGGTIAPEASCTVRVNLSVPAGATPGAYTNTTSTVTGTVDGSPVVGNMATDDLFVAPVPLLTKEFLEVGTLAPDPVIDPGLSSKDVILRFTLTNTSSTSGATDVAFIDELTDGGPGTGFLPFPISAVLPATPCGAGSSLGFVFPDIDRQGLSLTGGSLAAAGMPGDSCTFDVTLTVPASFPPGVYLNATGEPSATVDGATRTGKPASDTLTVISAPTLTKAFTNDPVAPGSNVTLEFTLNYPADASGDATDITFTDDLAALAPALAGLSATLPPTPNPPCGVGSTLTGSAGNTLLTLTGGTLSPGGSCAFSVTLAVPAGAAPGTYTNTTSGVAAKVGGQDVTSAPASDGLKVAGLVFSKAFLGDPVVPGDTVTLRFTIDNLHPSDDATITFFTDTLTSALPGLAATGGPSVNTCGGTLSGTTSLVYVGGSVLSGTSCTIEVEVLVPLGAADGDYLNVTSSLAATQGGAVAIDPATDTLTVNSNLLQLTKSFTDDPIAPGDSVTLEFTLTNLDTLQAASAIGFSDDLGAALSGLTFDSVLFNDCGATVVGTGTDTIIVSDASLAAAGSCTLRVSLTVPSGAAASIYTNTSSDVSGTIGGFAVSGDPASDNLEVVQLLQFSKSFDGPSIATGTPKLTVTITNPGPTNVADLSFSDNLNDVISGLVATNLPLTDPCGTGSSISGTSFLTFTGGNLPPMGGTCSFVIELLVPGTTTAGTFPNTTSDLLQAGLKVSDPATASLTINPSADVSVTKDDGVTSATPGGSITYTIVASNAGPDTDPAATLNDTFPAALSCTYTSVAAGGATGNTAAASGNLAETLSMPAGSSVTYTVNCAIDSNATGTLSNTANVTPSINDNVTGNNSATDSDTVLLAVADLSVTKSDGVTSATPGGTLVYTIVAANAGPSDEPAATLNDTFPAVLSCSYTSVAAGGATGNTAAASGNLAETLSLPAGSSVTYTVSCSINASAIGTLSNTATITASISDTQPSNNSATDNDTVLAALADVVLTKTDSVDPVTAGNNLTYTLTATNNGPSDAQGIVVTDTLPAGVTLVSTTGCSEDPAGVPSCTLGTIAAGASKQYTVTVAVDAAASGTITNTASLASSTTLINTGNDSTSETTTVSTSADLVLTKTDSVDPVTAGNNLTYTLTATNNGPSDAQGIVVTDTLPAGVTLVSTTGCSEDPNGVPSCTLGTITAGASKQYTITVAVDSATSGTITNTASLTSTTPLVNTGDDSVSETTTVSASTDLVLSKGDSPDPVVAGNNLAYTLTVSNNGPSDALGVVVSDTLPAGVTLVSTTGCSEDPNGVPSCTLGTITAGASKQYTITVAVDSATSGTITNTASLTSTTPLVNTGDDSVSETTTVSASADLVLSKTDSVDPVVAGSNLSYTLTVSNNGPSDALGVVVSDTLPAGVSLVSTTGCSEDPNGVPSCTLGTIAAGASKQYTLSVAVSSAASGAITNTATVTSTTPLLNTGDDSASETTAVSPRRSFTGTLPSGAAGTISFTTSDPNCSFVSDPQFMDVAGFTPAPPANLEFVDGLISFMIENCAPGATVTITEDYAQPLGPAVFNWKAGIPWFVFPSVISGTTVTFDITDGGLGDEDTIPGKITDPHGAAFNRAAVIPVNNPLGLLLLVILLMLSGVIARKRRWF